MPINQASATDSNHAVVLGGSLAGMLAARVLARHYAKVTILERDRYPEQPSPRNGVPQARHVHVMLLRGLAIIESMMPGVTGEMESLGAAKVDSSADFHWLTPGGYAPRFNSGLPFLAVSRPLIDWVVRRRVQALRNVEIVEAVDVLGLVRSQGRGVDGIRMRRRDGSQTDAFTASLVVDATGRGSRMPDWLTVAGFDAPAETIVDGHCGYASRLYRRTAGSQKYRAVFSQAAPPRENRQGLAFPIEGGRWMVTLAGGGGDYPPVREDHFLDFARSLPDPEVYNVIRGAKPLGPIHGSRSDGNRLVHYERLAMPGGLVVIGDAVCAFNPVYGQGMTTAAIGAQLLGDCLAAGRTSAFQGMLAKAIAPAWKMSASEEYRYPGVSGPKAGFGTAWMHAYLDRVIASSCADESTRFALMEVLHMLRPPRVLLRPSILWGAFAGRRGGGCKAMEGEAHVEGRNLFAATRIGLG